jgi:predicted PurR-regulated permease PerM
MSISKESDSAMSPNTETTGQTSQTPRSNSALVFLAGLAAVGALYLARDVAIPIVLAALLALLLRPLFRRLQSWHVPSVLSSLLIVSVVALLFVTAVVTVANQGQSWLAKAPETVKRVRAMVPQGSGPIGDLFKATEAVRDLTHSNSGSTPLPVEVHSNEPAFTVLGASGYLVGATLIVFVLTFFLLSFSDTLLKQAVNSRPSFGEKRSVVSLLHHVENGISRYLATITFINVGLGIVTAVILWLLQIPNPLLWGVMAATLNYVPHVGALVCMGVLFLVGAAAHESLWYGAAVAGAFAFLTAAESYIVTPLVLSKSLQLSPLAVILSVLFWGWLWGIAGGLMAAPLLAIAKICCDEFEVLRPLGVILSGETADNRRSIPSQEAMPKPSTEGLVFSQCQVANRAAA